MLGTWKTGIVYIAHLETATIRTFNVFDLFFQVKIRNWVNGVEGESLVGISARFGVPLPSHDSEVLKKKAVLANPLNSCTKSSTEVTIS